MARFYLVGGTGIEPTASEHLENPTDDPTELAYGLKYALDWCDKHLNSEDRLARVFFGSFKDGLPKALTAVAAYVSSFSLGGDVLSQWCRYADASKEPQVAAKAFLEAVGLSSVEVVQSDIPYRSIR